MSIYKLEFYKACSEPVPCKRFAFHLHIEQLNVIIASLMKPKEKIQAITELLKETAEAHHAAYIDTDGFHPDWPIWYAEYLEDKLPQLIETDLTRSELTYFMVLLNKLQSSEAPDDPWTQFYARYLANRDFVEKNKLDS